MKLFEFSKEYKAVCESQSTRYGFRHVAILLKNGSEVFRSKACYYNRTWEAYEYQTVLRTLIEGYFDGQEQKDILKVINER